MKYSEIIKLHEKGLITDEQREKIFSRNFQAILERRKV